MGGGSKYETLMANTQGIQQLLAAEKKATEKVASARRRKARRLKQAQDEGEEEVEMYRKECEAKFKEFLKQYAGSQDDIEAKIDADTKRKMDELHKVALSQKEDTIQGVLLVIQQIKPQIHRNYRNLTEKDNDSDED